MLSDEPGIGLVGVAADADEAIRLATEKQPAVAVLDARMTGGGGSRAAQEIVPAVTLNSGPGAIRV